VFDILALLPTVTATRPRGARTETPRALTPTDPTITMTHELQQALSVFLAFSRFLFHDSLRPPTAGKERAERGPLWHRIR